MVYATYDYYGNTFYGVMEEMEFKRFSRQASAYLDQLTHGRITEQLAQSEAVQDACCAVSEVYHLLEHGGGIASESNDGISVSYVAASSTKTEQERLYEAAALYLGTTGLLYLGVN